MQLDFHGALDTAPVGPAPGQALVQDGRGHGADLVDPARQFLQRDAFLHALDAIDVGDLLAVELDDDLLEGVVLGVAQRDLQRSLAIWGVFLGRIRAGQ